MSLLSSLNISGSALAAERLRMDTISGNVANAESTRVGGERKPYQRQQVVFEPIPQGPSDGGGVQVAQILSDQSAPRQVYEPTNPDADPTTGMVAYPNVDVSTEMSDMLSASRAYEANVTVMNTAKQMAEKALDLGKA